MYSAAALAVTAIAAGAYPITVELRDLANNLLELGLFPLEVISP